MTRKEFKRSVSETAKKMLTKHGLRWQDIKITKYNTIEIGNVFFAQGDSASELVDGVPKDINQRSWLLYFLESAGAI